MPSFNLTDLEPIFRDFYTISHIRIGLLDTSMNERLAYPHARCALCEMVRKNPLIDEKCRQCDKEAFMKCLHQKNPFTYTCHAGLTESVIPVIHDNHALCYIMFGQVVPRDSAAEQRARITDYFQSYGFNRDELITNVSKIKTRSQEDINACSTIAASLVLFFINNQMIKPDKAHFIETLDAYIDAHIAEQIHISDLCELFFVSRSSLYNLAKPYLSCSLNDYILQKRIRFAQNLLLQSNISIADVAVATGFTDTNYFSRVFKQIVGNTPKKYRTDQAMNMSPPPPQNVPHNR